MTLSSQQHTERMKAEEDRAHRFREVEQRFRDLGDRLEKGAAPLSARDFRARIERLGKGA